MTHGLKNRKKSKFKKFSDDRIDRKINRKKNAEFKKKKYVLPT